MRFFRKRENENTVRSCMNEDKSKVFGVVGTVADLLEVGVLKSCDVDKSMWCFIPIDDMESAQFGTTRESACAGIE